LYSFDSYPEELFLSVIQRPDWSLEKWDEISRNRKMTAIGTSDAHQNIKVLGRQLDPYPISLRFVNTHVLAPRLDEKEIVSALQSGHAYVSHDLLADPTGFLFYVTSPNRTWIMGDDVPFQTGLQLTVNSPLPGRIRLYKNGEQVREVVGDTLTLPVAAAETGIYRTELSLKLLDQ